MVLVPARRRLNCEAVLGAIEDAGGGVGAIANRWSHLVMPSDYLVSVSVQLLLKAESDTCLTEAVARWAAAFGCGLNR
jgi:hypothetical protein